MSWKNQAQVDEELKGISDKVKLNKLYNLHRLINQTIFIENYEPNPAYARFLVRSSHAQEIIDSNSDIETDYSPEDIAVALIDLFYVEDLLIDLDASNIDEAISLFTIDLRQGKVLLPYRFGRVLYDKFNDDFNNGRTEFLESDDVINLLNNTEQGVYQIGDLLSGPFGLLTSSEDRYMPPSLELPLWHCSDTGCSALHSVTLHLPDSSKHLAYNDIYEASKDLFGHSSEWEGPFSYLHRNGRWDGGRSYTDLCILIGDTIVGDERKHLLANAINGESGKLLRDVLRSVGGKKSADGSAIDVVNKLNSSEQLQLLFLLKDNELIRIIDECVYNRLIKIPANELRKSRTGVASLRSLDKYCELSMYGVRSNSNDPAVSLSSAIWNAYNDAGLLEDLAWRCRKESGPATPGIIMSYLRDHTPQQVIQNIVIPSRTVLKSLADKFQIYLNVSEDDNKLIERVLWKVGFDVARYEDEYMLFRNRLSHFNDVLLEVNEIKNESDREKIRSAGVNLFVSLEHILEEIISYNVWVLSSDHFVETKFKFNIKDAVKAVSRVIGSKILSGNYEVVWNEKGGNTLGVLLSYLSATEAWMLTLLDKPRESLKRPVEDFPHYISDEERIFAFSYTELWANSSEEELKTYYASFSKAVKLFMSSNLAEIRNGIDHNRKDIHFPEMNSMLACCSRIGDAFNIIDGNRFIPKTYWLTHKQMDIYGRVEIEAMDYQKKLIRLFGPTEMSGLPSVKFGVPAVVPFGNLLNVPNSELILGIQEGSNYSDYWAGYPRRRFIPYVETEGQEFNADIETEE